MERKETIRKLKEVIQVKYFLIIFIVFSIFIKNIFCQSIPENLNSNIYDFVDRMEIKNIIFVPSEEKPYDISKIKLLLRDLQSKIYYLNETDKLKLNNFLNYYRLSEDKYYLNYEYKEGKFLFNISPIAGYSFDYLDKLKGYTRVGGLKLYTNYNDFFNAYFLIQDRGEFGDSVDSKKDLSPQRGYAFVPAPNGIEYSDIIAGIVFDWNWAKLGLVKDYNRWGSGLFGQIILSDNVNSFPHLKFEFNPIDWFRFKFIFGWLNSQVIDSSYFYNSQPGSKLNEKRFDFINKYFVANLFTFQPFDYLSFSVGNSFIYSGSFIRLETLIPFSLFKFDKDVGKGSIADGNGQMFFDANFNYFSGLRLYGTFFIDALSLRKTFNGDYSEKWFGYTIGGKMIDPLLENLELEIEYTKIDPWVYEHKDVTTTYKHLNYQLGHWIGQNADLVNIRLRSYLLHNLVVVLDLQNFRKGGIDDIYYAYEGRDEKKFYFLYSPVRKDLSFGLTINYEPLPGLLLFLNYKNSKIQDEDLQRTPAHLIGNKNFIKFGLEFGFPF